MKRLITLAFLFALTVLPASATVWYIRTDGGTYTQCTGTTNAAYPGSGSAQACAYNHPYWMLTYAGAWRSFTGGDTLQFEDQGPYYMGEQLNGVGSDWHTTNGTICSAANTSSTGCHLPAFPSGTSGNTTKVYGANRGSCHNAGHTALVNPTVLVGINAAFSVIRLDAQAYGDVQCIDITQPDTCTIIAGVGAPTGFKCVAGSNNYATNGIIFENGVNQGPSNTILRDIGIHGISSTGILGSKLNLLSTDIFTASDIYIQGNGAAGWNADGGGCTTHCESLGTVNLSYLTVQWNGCVEVHPNGGTVGGNGYTDCTDQSSGSSNTGYGDGLVFIASQATFNVSYSNFKWNTQDGFDALHISDDRTVTNAINLWNSWAEGNEGQQFKMGATNAKAWNNIAIGNCNRLATAFSPNPSGYNTYLGAFCRAAGDQWAFQMTDGTTITLQNNTTVGYGATMYPAALQTGGTCTTARVMIFQNNLSMGESLSGYNSNQLPGGWYWDTGDVFANSPGAINNNLWYHLRTSPYTTTCPQDPTYETAYICSDPLLVAESNPDAINPNLTVSSPAIGAGAYISAITTDYNGVTRPNPPSIGALEYQSGGSSSNAGMSGNVSITGGGKLQ
jgi:hypothetical protein